MLLALQPKTNHLVAMFPTTDNPAERLLEIFELSKKHTQESVMSMWGRVFEIDNIDVPTCYRILGHLNFLVDSVEARINQIPDIDHDLHLESLPVLRAIICQTNLTSPWRDVRAPLDKGALTGLKFCSSVLGKNHAEDKIPQEELERIREEFSYLLSEVAGSDLDGALKTILYDILSSALISIEQYKILGNDGLKRSVAYIIGVFSLHKDKFISHRTESIVGKTMSSVKNICLLLTTACKVAELGESVKNFLEAKS